jgi:4-oxalocrotonate tautomerase
MRLPPHDHPLSPILQEDPTMPILHVEMLAGRTPEQKKQYAQALTETTIRVLGVPPEAVDVLITEVQRQDWFIAGVPFSEKK